MTCSIGFRVPARDALAADLLQRLWDGDEPGPLYRDPQQAATVTPARVPAALQTFAGRAVARLLAEPGRLEQALGEALSEPKPQVWFEPGGDWSPADGLRLDARTRMLYDDQCVYINGESLRARGTDALLVRALADQRWLAPSACRRLSAAARAEVAQWVADGWAHPADGSGPGDAPA
jgi:50S ribosomal protein L16 3-hydroxylase